MEGGLLKKSEVITPQARGVELLKVHNHMSSAFETALKVEQEVASPNIFRLKKRLKSTVTATVTLNLKIRGSTQTEDVILASN